MPGHYSKPAPAAPPFVQWIASLERHRRKAIAAGIAVMVLLVVLSFFLPTLGLSLLAVAVVGALALLLVVRAKENYRTHWTRATRRR